jgi:hypothetical protein
LVEVFLNAKLPQAKSTAAGFTSVSITTLVKLVKLLLVMLVKLAGWLVPLGLAPFFKAKWHKIPLYPAHGSLHGYRS